MSENQIPVKMLGGESTGERRGPRIVEIAESLNTVRSHLQHQAEHEFEVIHNLAVLDFLSSAVHPARMDSSRDYLDAIGYVLDIVRRDLEKLYDTDIAFKGSVRRYLNAMGLGGNNE